MEAGHPPVGEWIDRGPSTQQSVSQHGKEALGEETTACYQVNEAALKGCTLRSQLLATLERWGCGHSEEVCNSSSLPP